MDDAKTALMFRLERQFGRDILELISSKGLRGIALARNLGVSEATISLWRKRLGVTTRYHHRAKANNVQPDDNA